MSESESGQMLCFPPSVDDCSFGVCKEGKEGILINKHKLISYYKLRFIFFQDMQMLRTFKSCYRKVYIEGYIENITKIIHINLQLESVRLKQMQYRNDKTFLYIPSVRVICLELGYLLLKSLYVFL